MRNRPTGIDYLVREKERLLAEIVELRESEARLLQRAHYDELTGLPNRHLLQDRMNQAFAFEERNRRLVALLVVDIDNFKEINDTFGHAAGDEILCCVARRLQESTRQYDTVARFGGDEFVVLLANVPEYDLVVKCTDKLISFFAAPFSVEGLDVYVSVSVGIAIFPFDGVNSVDLLRKADEAMFVSKKKGKNMWTMALCGGASEEAVSGTAATYSQGGFSFTSSVGGMNELFS